MTSSAALGLSPHERWGKTFTPVSAFSWRADPPEWAAYVSSVLVIDRGTEVHLSIDMRCKRVGAYVDEETLEVGAVRILFHTTPTPDDDHVWPLDVGPWTRDEVPAVVVTLGERVSSMEVVSCFTARYTTRVSLVRALHWREDGVEVAAPPNHAAYEEAQRAFWEKHLAEHKDQREPQIVDVPDVIRCAFCNGETDENRCLDCGKYTWQEAP